MAYSHRDTFQSRPIVLTTLHMQRFFLIPITYQKQMGCITKNAHRLLQLRKSNYLDQNPQDDAEKLLESDYVRNQANASLIVSTCGNC